MGKIDVAVIGAGNWGTSLIAALRKAGIPVREIISRSARGGIKLQNARLEAKILWLCVPDRAVAQVATEIAAMRGSALRGQVVVHSSGALTVEALEKALNAGAAIASVHPVMSFPARRIVPLQDVMFGIEAPQPATKRLLYGIVRKLGGRPFPVDSRKKALYHAAGTLASPLLVSELSAAVHTARLAGLSKTEAQRFVGELAQATMRNFLERGAGQSFSGPFARGDVATISLHLRALARHPMVTDMYGSLARYAVETLPVERRRELRSLLKLT